MAKESNHIYGFSQDGGIGDYIHYRLQGYRDYGIAKTASDKQPLSSSAKEKDLTGAIYRNHQYLQRIINNRNIRNVTQKKAELLQQYLNNFIYGNYNNIKDTQISVNSNTQVQFGEAMNRILAESEKKWGELGVDWTSMDFTLKRLEAILTSTANMRLYKNSAGAYVTPNTLENIKSNLKNLLDDIQKQQQLLENQSWVDASILIKLDSLNTTAMELKKKLENAIKAEEDVLKNEQNLTYGFLLRKNIKINNKDWNNSSNREKITYLKNNNNGKLTTIGDIIIAYNEYLDNFKALTQQILPSDYGNIGEKTIAAILLVGGGIVQTTADNLTDELFNKIDEAVVSTNKSGTILPGLSSYIQLDTVNKDWNKINKDRAKLKKKKISTGKKSYVTNLGNDKVLKLGLSNDTVDVSVELAEGSDLQKLLGNSRLSVSMKNVANITESIKILNQAPFEALLALTLPEFMNHYLNLIATHNDGQINTSDVMQANNELFYMVAVRALTGARGTSFQKGMHFGSTQNADYLIVNQRNRSQENPNAVYVWATSYLLNEMSNNLNSIKDYIQIRGLPSELNNEYVHWSNDINSFGAASTRITKIISQLHKYELEVSLKTKQIL